MRRLLCPSIPIDQTSGCWKAQCEDDIYASLLTILETELSVPTEEMEDGVVK
jgi:hypothetical protein